MCFTLSLLVVSSYFKFSFLFVKFPCIMRAEVLNSDICCGEPAAISCVTSGLFCIISLWVLSEVPLSAVCAPLYLCVSHRGTAEMASRLCVCVCVCGTSRHLWLHLVCVCYICDDISWHSALCTAWPSSLPRPCTATVGPSLVCGASCTDFVTSAYSVASATTYSTAVTGNIIYELPLMVLLACHSKTVSCQVPGWWCIEWHASARLYMW